MRKQTQKLQFQRIKRKIFEGDVESEQHIYKGKIDTAL